MYHVIINGHFLLFDKEWGLHPLLSIHLLFVFLVLVYGLQTPKFEEYFLLVYAQQPWHLPYNATLDH